MSGHPTDADVSADTGAKSADGIAPDALLRRAVLAFVAMIGAMLALALVLAVTALVEADGAPLSVAVHVAGLGGLALLGVALAWTGRWFGRQFLSPALRLLQYLAEPIAQRTAIPALPARWDAVVARVRELETARRQMQAFFDNTPAERHIRALDGTLEMVSAPRGQGRHFARAARCGDSLYASLPPEQADRIRAVDRQIVASGEAHVEEGHYNPAAPDEVGLLVSFPIRNSHGAIESIGSFYLDLTEARAAQAELELVRSLLQGFFDSVPAAMYVRDADDRFAMINRWGAAAIGMTPEALAGQPFGPFRALTDAARAQAVHDRVMATGEVMTDEWVYHLPGGDRTGLVTVFPIRDRQGRITQLGGVIFDVTEHRAAQAELGQARAILESFVEHAPFPFGLVDPRADGGPRLVLLNPAAQDYYGDAGTAAVLGGDGSAFARFWPEWDGKVAQLSARVLADGTPQVVETLFDTHTGERRRVRLSVFPVFDESDAIRFVGSAAVDLTDIHIAQETLARSRDAIHQSDKLAALGQLVAGVAHELNNPLAVVLGRAELLQEQLRDTPQSAAIDKLLTAADRCARIVKSFLAMARQTGPRRVLVNLNELIDVTLDLTGNGLRTLGVEIECDLGEDLPNVTVDDDQLVQVLINLVINAQHALEGVESRRVLRLRTYANPQRDRIFVTVGDNGRGIAPHARSRIFDPFFSTKDVGKGTGLGLSVSKGIVDAHGGMLELVETGERGTTFRISLPVDQSGSAIGSAAAQPDKPAGAKGRVLIIDDEPEVGELVAECLTPLELSCEVVMSAEQALGRLRDRSYSVIFADVRMPGMDGLELFHRIEHEWPEQARRVVFISGDVLHRDFGDIASASGRPVIEKPFNFNLVREAAVAVLARGGQA